MSYYYKRYDRKRPDCRDIVNLVQLEMGRSNGIRRGTRSKFSKPFRQHGLPGVSRLLTVYKKGDFVDIRVDPSVQKGMPHHYYHGRTGVVYNVTKTSLGVIVNKRVRQRIIKKRINCSIAHVRKSRCNEDYKMRIAKIKELTINGVKNASKLLKRSPVQPREATIVRSANLCRKIAIPVFVETV